MFYAQSTGTFISGRSPSIKPVKSLRTETAELRSNVGGRSMRTNIGCIHPGCKIGSVSIQTVWFYLCWCKHVMLPKPRQRPDIIWVAVPALTNFTAIWAPMKNCRLTVQWRPSVVWSVTAAVGRRVLNWCLEFGEHEDLVLSCESERSWRWNANLSVSVTVDMPQNSVQANDWWKARKGGGGKGGGEECILALHICISYVYNYIYILWWYCSVDLHYFQGL